MNNNTSNELLLLSEKDNQRLLLERKKENQQANQAKLSSSLEKETQEFSALQVTQDELAKKIKIAEKILTNETEKKKQADSRLMNSHNDKEYKAFQKELQIISNIIKKQENLLFTYTEEQEAFQTKLGKATTWYNQQQEKINEQVATITKELEVMEQQISTLKQESLNLQEKLPPTLKSTYTKLTKHNIIPVALQIDDAFCSACGTKLTPHQFSELIKNLPTNCTNCKRILFYKAPETEA